MRTKIKSIIIYLISFSPYKEYRTKGNIDWNIKGILEADATAFWQYLYAKHEKEIASHYNHRVNDETPKGWVRVTREEAVKNLGKRFGVSLN